MSEGSKLPSLMGKLDPLLEEEQKSDRLNDDFEGRLARTLTVGSKTVVRLNNPTLELVPEN